MFSSLEIGDEVNDIILNEALKRLYYTDYFKEVELNFENQSVNIKVVENPIIQSVIVNGIKRDSINSKVVELTKKIRKVSFCRK